MALQPIVSHSERDGNTYNHERKSDFAVGSRLGQCWQASAQHRNQKIMYEKRPRPPPMKFQQNTESLWLPISSCTHDNKSTFQRNSSACWMYLDIRSNSIYCVNPVKNTLLMSCLVLQELGQGENDVYLYSRFWLAEIRLRRRFGHIVASFTSGPPGGARSWVSAVDSR